MEFLIIRAMVVLFLSISVQKIDATMRVVDYEEAEIECEYSNTNPPRSDYGLHILPDDYSAICEKGGAKINIGATPRDEPGFAKYEIKLVGVQAKASFNLLPCKTNRGILFMKRIADGSEDRCFVAYVHNPPLGSGGTYLRRGTSSQSWKLFV